MAVSGQETEMSITAELGSVTVRQSTADDPRLHFCIRETDKCIQIGECCTYVEISINGPYLERMISQGQLSRSGEVQSSTGEKIPVFQIHWSDIGDVNQIKHYVSKLKVELDTARKDIKNEVMKEIFCEMPKENMKNIRDIVDKIFRIINGRLVNIGTGCLELTIIYDSEKSARKLQNPDTLKDLENFFTGVLITKKILEINKDIALTIRLLDTEEISRSEVMKYRFGPVIPSNLQSTMQAVETDSIEKQEEIVALVEDRLKNATAQITQRVEESLSNHSKAFKEDLQGVRSEIHRQQQVISTEVINQLIPRFNEMLLQNLLPRIQESITTPQSRELPQHISPVTELQQEVPDTHVLGKKIEQPEMESGPVTPEQPGMESLGAVETQRPEMESLGTVTPQPGMESELIKPSVSSERFGKREYTSRESEHVEVKSIDELAEKSKKRPFRRKTSSAPKTEQISYVETPETEYLVPKKEIMQKSDAEVKETSTEYINKFLELMMGNIEKEGYEEESKKSLIIETTTAIGSRKTKEMVKSTTPWIRKYMNEAQIQDTIAAIRKAKSDMKKFKLHKSEAVDNIVVLLPSHDYSVRNILREMVMYRKSKKENVALIDCTRGAQIVHPFPCSWDDVIYHLDDPGKSDFDKHGYKLQKSVLTGLLIALYVIADTGKVLSVGRYHRVLPRIFILSARKFESEILELLEEMYYFDINPYCILEPHISELAVLKHQGFERDIFRLKMMKHQEFEIMIGKALTYIKEPKDNESNHQTLLDDFLSTTSGYEKDYCRGRIAFILDIPPPLGTRVRWNAWKTYEGERTGTVVKHIDPCLVQVIFDDGKEQYFEWCFYQNYLTFSPPPKPTTKEQLPVGTLVHRGTDWNFGDQDGGENEIGVVINRNKFKDGNLERQVCWRSPFAINKINMYRFGDQGQFDIQELNYTPERSCPAIPERFAWWEQVHKGGTLSVRTCAILESISEDFTGNEVKEAIISIEKRQMMIEKSEKDFKMVDMTDDTKYTLRKTDKIFSRHDYLDHKYYSMIRSPF